MARGQGHLAVDLLLGDRRLHPAAVRRVRGPERRRRQPGQRRRRRRRRRRTIFVAALGSNWAALVLFISAVGQFFCATSCMTSASRMMFAFSRDGAVPGSRHWSKLDAKRVPANAVHAASRCVAAIVTLPALIEVNVGTRGAADHPGRVLRRHLDRRHRALPGVRDPDLAAVAARRQVRGRAVEQRLEVQVDEPDRGGRDRRSSRCT